MNSFPFNFLMAAFWMTCIYFIAEQMLSTLREGGRIQQSRLYSLIRFVWSFHSGGGKSINSWNWLSSSLFSGLIMKSKRACSVPNSLKIKRKYSCFRRWKLICLSGIYPLVSRTSTRAAQVNFISLFLNALCNTLIYIWHLMVALQTDWFFFCCWWDYLRVQSFKSNLVKDWYSFHC